MGWAKVAVRSAVVLEAPAAVGGNVWRRNQPSPLKSMKFSRSKSLPESRLPFHGLEEVLRPPGATADRRHRLGTNKSPAAPSTQVPVKKVGDDVRRLWLFSVFQRKRMGLVTSTPTRLVFLTGC